MAGGEVDGLRAQGYSIDLANPAKIEQYSGMKHVDDKDAAFHLADLQRLNILPKAHVYDPELRPVRDLLRRRTNLVHQHTRTLAMYKCDNCGFRARQYYWHCPACGEWETYLPRRAEEKELPA